MAKLRSAGADAGGDGDEPPAPAGLDPKVVEVYRAVGELMSRYKSGKVPKAFKVIPALSNWEEARAPAQGFQGSSPQPPNPPRCDQKTLKPKP